MAGLACGEVSELAWEILGAGTNAAVAVPDRYALAAVRAFAHPATGDPAIVSGETGAAGLAALLAAQDDPAIRAALALDATRACCCSAAKATPTPRSTARSSAGPPTRYCGVRAVIRTRGRLTAHARERYGDNCGPRTPISIVTSLTPMEPHHAHDPHRHRPDPGAGAHEHHQPARPRGPVHRLPRRAAGSAPASAARPTNSPRAARAWSRGSAATPPGRRCASPATSTSCRSAPRPGRATRSPREIADGRLYGRGSSDMKSGVAAFVTAAIELAPRLARGPGLVLVITAGEETGCEGAFAPRRAAQGRAILGTRRRDGRRRADGQLPAGRPQGRALAEGEDARRHRARLDARARRQRRLQGGARGRGAGALRFRRRAATRCWAPPTLNVGTIRGGLNINSVPDAAEIGIDIRTIPGQRPPRAAAAACAATSAPTSTLRAIVDVESVYTDPADPWMQRVFAVMAPLLGEPLVPRRSPTSPTPRR